MRVKSACANTQIRVHTVRARIYTNARQYFLQMCANIKSGARAHCDENVARRQCSDTWVNFAQIFLIISAN